MNDQKSQKSSTGLIIGVIIGVTVVIIGVIVGAIVFILKSSERDTSERRTEKATESTEAVVTDDTETTTEQVASETDNQMNEAYLKVLAEHASSIKLYNWQYGYEADNSEPIAFEDLDGDGINELIFMEAQNAYTAGVLVYGYRDGEAQCLLDYSYLDGEVAGGSHFYVGKLTNHAGLFTYHTVSDECAYEYYEELTLGQDGKYTSSGVYEFDTCPNEDYSGTDYFYYLDEAEISETDFNDFVNSHENSIEKILLHSEGDDIEAKVSSLGCSSMDLERAKAELNAGPNLNLDEIFVDLLPVDVSYYFSFTSGAGGWATTLYMDANGNFTGTYHDSEMGSTGDGYPNGTVYFCSFSGKFTDIEKIDDYTYKMRLEGYETKNPVDSEEISDEFRYVYTEPYGIEGGDVFYLYTPGKPVSELSEEFVSWAIGNIGDISGDATMKSYGLYNESMGEGFFTYSE